MSIYLFLSLSLSPYLDRRVWSKKPTSQQTPHPRHQESNQATDMMTS